MVEQGKQWEVPQTIDSITPGHARYNERSRLAKTMRKDGSTWGDVPEGGKDIAHPDAKMTCFTCHSSWMTSCAGCHLPMYANERRPDLHNENDITRNWTSYNFQVIRDDTLQLGIDGNVTGNRVAPVRSSSAVIVGSQRNQREWTYSQQQTISSEGYSGQAFNTHVPHTVRGKETKQCSDCHVSADGDNNAWMAQLLLQGTNLVNFLGRYVYVAEGKGGWRAVVATEADEPQAVLGSRLHELAYPDKYQQHVARGGTLPQAYRHRGPDLMIGGDEVRSIQLRGEYLYTANGSGGFRIYDVAQIDQKNFSQRVFTSPVSPLGQRFYVKTKDATALVAPTTLGVDPARVRRPENAEQPIHLLYAFLYGTDRQEGLIMINAATLLDGDPDNNFLKKDVAFNPGGALDGAVNLTVAGRYVYVLAKRGLVIVDVDNPFQPRLVAEVGAPAIVDPRAVAVQFRYAFVTDSQGLKVIDVTNPAAPAAGPERRGADQGRARPLRGPDLRLRGGGRGGAGDRGRGEAGGAEARPDVQRRRPAQRQQRREGRHDQRQRLRLRGRRPERAARPPDVLAEGQSGLSAASARGRRRGWWRRTRRAGRPWRCPRVSTATGRWTSRGTRWPSSAAGAPGPSTSGDGADVPPRRPALDGEGRPAQHAARAEGRRAAEGRRGKEGRRGRPAPPTPLALRRGPTDDQRGPPPIPPPGQDRWGAFRSPFELPLRDCAGEAHARSGKRNPRERGHRVRALVPWRSG